MGLGSGFSRQFHGLIKPSESRQLPLLSLLPPVSVESVPPLIQTDTIKDKAAPEVPADGHNRAGFPPPKRGVGDS